MSFEASTLLEKAQRAREQAARARRLANEVSAADVAAQLWRCADELEESAGVLEQRAAAAAAATAQADPRHSDRVTEAPPTPSPKPK